MIPLRQPIRANVAKSAVFDPYSLRPPVGGWDAVNALADMPEDRAVVLTNFFPEPDSVSVRRGFKTHATGMGSGVVQSVMPYQGQTSASSKLFAATGGTIYDTTAEATATATTITGLSNNKLQHTNFTLSAGTHYLWTCNGADTPKAYNGTAWVVPSISGITSSDIINVNVHKNRLWFCLVDSMNAAYLNTDSFQGTATKFNLGSVMGKGGFLVAMGTWTKDAGAGPDDYAVFLSSRGQAAVYQGTDPTSATTWDLVGVYDLGAPIGYRCFQKVGGDLALINIDGVLPISRALNTDRGAAAQIAITSNINNAFNQAARLYSGQFGWQLTPYPKATMAIVNVPFQEGVLQHQFVMNTLTGAWCDFNGWNFNTFAVFNDNLYAGSNDGKVNRCDFGARDGTAEITAIGQTAYSYYKARGVLKKWAAMRALLTTDSSSRPSLGISTDFKDNAVLGTPTAGTIASALYDSAIYDTDVYAVEGRSVTDWTSISGIGQAASVHFRASTMSAGEVQMSVNGFDILYQRAIGAVY